MTPVEIAIFASVFFVFIMLVFVVMFFTTAGLGKRKEREFSFPTNERLFELYRAPKEAMPRALPVPSANVMAEQMRQAIADGALLRARVLALLAAELRQEPDFCPREVAQVFLPGLHQMKKPVDAEIFSQIAHPSIQGPLTPLLATLANPLLFSMCAHPAAYDLGGEHAASRQRRMEPVLGMVYHLSRLLLPFEPEIYAVDAPFDIVHIHTSQAGIWMPSLVVGKRFTERPLEQQRVLMARKLALFRPELRILTTAPAEAKFVKCMMAHIGQLQEKQPQLPGWFRLPEADRAACMEIAQSIQLTPETLAVWRHGAILSCFRLAMLVTGQWQPMQALLAEEADPAIRVDLMAYMAKELYCETVLQLRA